MIAGAAVAPPRPRGAPRPHAAEGRASRVRATRVRADAPARAWAAAVAVGTGGALAAALVVGLPAALALAATLALAGALVGLRVPVLGLYSVAVLCALDAMTRVYVIGDGLLRWNTFNYLLLLASALGAPLLLRFRSLPLRLLQGFWLLLALGLLFSGDRARGLDDLLAMSAVFGLFVYAARAAQAPGVWYWLGPAVGIPGVIAGAAFFLLRAGLPTIDANAWALSAATPVFALAVAALVGAREGRPVLPLLALAAVAATWVLLSGSRGSMLAAVIALVVALRAARGVHRQVGALLLVALVAAGLAATFATQRDAALRRVDRLLAGDGSLATRTSHRWSLAVGGLLLFADHPVTGVGTGGFIPAWRAMTAAADERARRIPDYAVVARGRDAHAGWVKVAAENGIPGLLLLAAALAALAAAGRRAGEPAVARLAALTLAVLLVSTEYRSKAGWFVVAVALARVERVRLAEAGHAWRRERRA